MVPFRGLALLLIPLGLCLGAGCGQDSNAVKVTGKVALDGHPVEGGNIAFYSAGAAHGGSAGAEIENGEYRIVQDRLSPGSYLVKIHCERKTGKQIPTVPPGGMMDEVVEAIPERYNVKSTLKVELKPGDNVQNFDLTSKK